jgi:hypothetical protein
VMMVLAVVAVVSSNGSGGVCGSNRGSGNG